MHGFDYVAVLRGIVYELLLVRSENMRNDFKFADTVNLVVVRGLPKIRLGHTIRGDPPPKTRFRTS